VIPWRNRPPGELKAMRGDDDYFAPLWNTAFLNSGFDIEQYVQLISNYLEAHLEKWNKRADNLIEDALVDAFPAKQ
jgi:hypothetical protein